MPHFYPDQSAWAEEAEQSRPVHFTRETRPAALARLRPSVAAFQGWEAAAAGPFPETVRLRPGESAIADFGEHGVGALDFRLASSTGYNDSPVRLRVTLAEVPLELAEPMPDAPGLSRSWRQEDIMWIDVLPRAVRLGRRHAFRYARVEWWECHAHYEIDLAGLSAVWTSTAPWNDPPAAPGADRLEAELSRIAARTLRNCMQDFFEDGPKRDRRLWLGDLRLQALANEATFREFPLARRCLYLLAAACAPDGQVPGCVYDRAPPLAGDHVEDYAALFGPALADYARASGDESTARRLLPVALRQYELLLARLDGDGRYRGGKWVFIDWKEGLATDAALAGVILYGMAATERLAGGLGETEMAARLRGRGEELRNAARRAFVGGDGLVRAGPAKQVSQASWAWAALSGLLTPVEAAAAWRAMEGSPSTLTPGTPYLMHHVIDALCVAGLAETARRTLRGYWGGMAGAGLTTFPEVWDPDDAFRSPYGAAAMNSYCHAWSCTPPWLLARIAEAANDNE